MIGPRRSKSLELSNSAALVLSPTQHPPDQRSDRQCQKLCKVVAIRERPFQNFTRAGVGLAIKPKKTIIGRCQLDDGEYGHQNA